MNYSKCSEDSWRFIANGEGKGSVRGKLLKNLVRYEGLGGFLLNCLLNSATVFVCDI